MPYNLIDSGEGRSYLDGRFKRIRLGALNATFSSLVFLFWAIQGGLSHRRGWGLSLPCPAPETALASQYPEDIA